MKKRLFHFIILIGAVFLFFSFGNAFQIEDKLSMLPVQKDRLNYINILLAKADSLSALSEKDNYKKVTLLLQKSFKMSQEMEDLELIKKSGFQLIKHLTYNDVQLAYAKSISKNLFRYCKLRGDSLCLASTYLRLGDIEKRELRFVAALENFTKASKIYNERGTDLDKWRSTFSIGNIFSAINDTLMARKEYRKALKVIPKIDYNYHYMLTVIHLGNTHKYPDSSVFYFKKALVMCDDPKRQRECFMANNNIAYTYTLAGQPQKSMDIINTSIDTTKVKYQLGDNLYSSLMHTIGINHYQLKAYTKALDYLNIALKGYLKRNELASIAMVHKDLATCYEDIGQLNKSLYHLRESWTFHDILDDQKLEKEIAIRESRNLLDINQQKKISSLENENAKMSSAVSINRRFIYFLAGLALTGIFIIFYLVQKNKLKMNQINQELSVSHMKSLRSVMNPHFMFNSFNALQNLILKNKNERANEYMTELSGLIRRILNTSESIYIKFQKEVEFLRAYVAVEQGRHDQRFEVEFNQDPSLIKINPKIPSMIIQPYVENAIVHGFALPEKKYSLKINFLKKDDYLCCTITDNGVGRARAGELKKLDNKSHLSIATGNTIGRLELLNKIGHDRATVKIEDLFSQDKSPIGTRVIVTLPFIN